MNSEDRLLDIQGDIAEWIEALQRSDQTFYNMMTIEFWAIARTMDSLEPGFWSQYMQNRQKIFQQQLRERQQRNTSPETESPDSPPELDLAVSPEDETGTSASERVSLISEALDKTLSRIQRLQTPEDR